MNVLIKFSGEFFDAKDDLTQEGKDFLTVIVKNNYVNGYVVIGGGNRIRGRSSSYSRNASDNIGVISTIMNGFILKEHFKQNNMNAVLFTHFVEFGQLYSPEDAINSYEKGSWVILAGGLGKVGYVSTDLNAVIKALEVNADCVIKITKSDGIYDKDPKFDDAKFIKQIDYDELLEKKLSVMDFSAVSIAQEQNLPIAIININDFSKFMNNKDVGSIIGKDWRK